MSEPLAVTQEHQNDAADSLTPQQLEEMVLAADSMMTEDYYADEEGISPMRSIYFETSDDIDESYYLSQYVDDDEAVLSLYIPRSNDGYLHIAPNGKISFEGDETDMPKDKTLAEATVSIFEEFCQKYEEYKINKDEELRLAERGEPANIHSPEEITEAERIRILNEASYPDGHNGHVLSAEFIRQAGVEPREKMQLTDKLTLYAGLPFSSDGRIHVLTFTEYEDEIVPRTYYQSMSQGIWRYVPGIVRQDGNDIYDKGAGEFSLDLPLEVQDLLNSQLDRKLLHITAEQKDHLVDGTFTSASRRHETHHLKGVNPLIDDSAGMSMATLKMIYKGRPLGGAEKPEDLAFKDEMMDKYPDFTTVEERGKSYSPLYGKIHYHKVSSHDGTWMYLFSEDQSGRVWLSHAEDVSAPISPAGLRKSFPSLGLLFTPAEEYKSQAGDFGGREMPGSSYVDVYDKFVSKLPIIQDCIRALASPQQITQDK